MSDRAWIRVHTLGAYVLARILSQVLVTGSVRITRETLAHMLTVPLAQLVVLELASRIRPWARVPATRFLLFWLLLAPTLAVVTVGISLGVFQHLDLTYGAFFQTLVVPTCQALVLTWVTKRPGALSLARALLHDPAKHALVVPLLIMDVALLASGWLFSRHYLWGIGGTTSLHVVWIGTKAIAASWFLGSLAAGRGTPGSDSIDEGWRRRERAWVLAFGAGVFALGLDAFVPWLRPLPARVLPGQPTVIQWVVVYGVLFSMMIAMTLETRAVVASRLPLAALYFDVAAAAAFGVTLIVVLNVFLRPYLLPPWLGIVRTGTSLATTCVLVGAIAARTGQSNSDHHTG